MNTLTPVILFGVAAIAGHTWGEEFLAFLGVHDTVERWAARLRRHLFDQ